LTPSQEQRDELAALVQSVPTLAQLAVRQPGDPESPNVVHAGSFEGTPVYPMVQIPWGGDAGLWAGGLPGFASGAVQRDLVALVAFGIRRIVCLVPTQDLEGAPGFRTYVERARALLGEDFRALGIADFGTPPDDDTFEREVDAAIEALARGEQVLVHCFAGCGRTGLFVSCLLVRRGEPVVAAVRRFRRVRGCGPETPEQVAYVMRYAQRIATGKSKPPPVET